jgi:hypothetical protein
MEALAKAQQYANDEWVHMQAKYQYTGEVHDNHHQIRDLPAELLCPNMRIGNYGESILAGTVEFRGKTMVRIMWSQTPKDITAWPVWEFFRRYQRQTLVRIVAVHGYVVSSMVHDSVKQRCLECL